MKYYRLYFKQLFKLKLYKLFFLYFILYGMLLLVFYLSNFDFDVYLFNIIIGNFQMDTLLSVLWMLFQVIFHIYIVYLFTTYDKIASFEFIVLRESNRLIVRKKILILLTSTLLFRMAMFLFTYFVFFRSISFPYCSLVFNLCVYIIIVFVVSIVAYSLDNLDL